MNIYWFQYAHEAYDELVTVIVDAPTMEAAKVIIFTFAAQLGIDLDSDDEYSLNEYELAEVQQDPRWSDQLERMMRLPRLTILTRRDVEQHGLVVADPDDPTAFERARSAYLARATQ